MTETAIPKARTRVNWTAAERTEWLALFEKSGQTAAEFCRDNDLSPATLSFWRQQVGSESNAESGLVEVPMPSLNLSGSRAAVTLHLSGGARLEIVAGTDPAWLSQLVRALLRVKG
jgi:transposase-like protein